MAVTVMVYNFGGRWDGGHFRYNTAVVNVNRTVIHNTYIDRTVINNTTINNHTSFNGGTGGTHARPSEREQSAMKENHISPTSNQTAHEQTARQDKSQYASANHGRPATTAMNTVGGNKFGQQGHPANAMANHQQGASNHTQPTSNKHSQGANNATHQQSHATPAIHQSAPTVQHNSGSMNGGYHSQPQQHAAAPQQHAQVQQQQHTQQPQQRAQAPQQHAPAQHQVSHAGGGEHEHR